MPPGGRRSRQQKCHGSTEQLVGNNIDRCLTLLCGRMAGTMIQQHCSQLFSHLEGDALNAAHLVPLSRRLSRSGLVDALTAHYGSLCRLADYRRQFERTTRTVGEDPAIFATALETLAVKAFGDMGQTALLRLIRDRFIAGHSSCELRRDLDSVPPETPIRDVVDRCRVWESHADPAVSLVRIRSIQPMLSEMPTGPVRPQGWRQSPDRDRARIN